MKNLLFTLLFSLPLMAQHNFRAEDGNIVWEKAFPVNNVNVVAMIESHPELTVDAYMDNLVQGGAKEMAITGEGGSGLMQNNCKFDYVIVMENGQYIVKVKDFKFLEKMGPMQMRTVASSWEKYFMDERKIRPTPITQGNLQHLDNFLTGIFAGAAITSSGELTAN
ncbi:hypothetical protein OGH69_00425 [Flavobacterium sp. MFBS3-15]|uniref:hypothetical protein n=1 Tax=Flavobacterium sp. MFBS3-15 TaxID=2989816 RepID=UPI002235A991|nr:hypothetical protein [Flavobacterium sp. MFBS3-15]MCW4467418.1 hypothetical protein [Flavobacterium sp. MFBS3-15]